MAKTAVASGNFLSLLLRRSLLSPQGSLTPIRINLLPHFRRSLLPPPPRQAPPLLLLCCIQAAEADLAAAEELHGGYGPAAEECDELRRRMQVMKLTDRRSDRSLYGKMFGG